MPTSIQSANLKIDIVGTALDIFEEYISVEIDGKF